MTELRSSISLRVIPKDNMKNFGKFMKKRVPDYNHENEIKILKFSIL